jgi:lipopolysaccharide biosynthesis regulator YciM
MKEIQHLNGIHQMNNEWEENINHIKELITNTDNNINDIIEYITKNTKETYYKGYTDGYLNGNNNSKTIQ